MKNDPVTEGKCEKCEANIHTRINQRTTWKLILWVLGVFFFMIAGSYGYTSTSMDKAAAKQEKVEAKQWDFSEKMVTQTDFREFKQENNTKLDRIQASIESLRR